MKTIERISVESLAYGGRGVARQNGKVCFIEGALPGEIVNMYVQKESAKYSEGKVKDIVKHSPDRMDPVCPYFGRCGGCGLQHISYEKELIWKTTQVKELFKRISKTESRDILFDIVPSDREYGYRSSITLHRGERAYGYFQSASHNIVPVEKCPVAVPVIGEDISVHTRGLSASDVTLKADYAGKVWSSERSGERFFTDVFRGKAMSFSPKAFSQCNRDISEKISETLEELILAKSENAAFFDIYSGAGFFSFTVKGDFDARIGIDNSRVSIDCAKNTVKMLGMRNAKFYRADAEKSFGTIFQREKRKRNIVLLDPPRRGAGKRFLEQLRDDPAIDFLYYLSCDPARLARDINILTFSGRFKLSTARPFDMFPRTGHIEVLSEFVR